MKKRYKYTALLTTTLVGLIGFASFSGVADSLMFWQVSEESVELPVAAEVAAVPKPETAAVDQKQVDETATPEPKSVEAEVSQSDIDPQYSAILTKTAETKMRAGETASAEKFLRLAIEQNPQNAKAKKYISIIDAGGTPEAPSLKPSAPKADDGATARPAFKTPAPTKKPTPTPLTDEILPSAPTVSPTPISTDKPLSEDERYAKLLAERAAQLALSGKLEEANGLFDKVQELDPSGAMFAYGTGVIMESIGGGSAGTGDAQDLWANLLLALETQTDDEVSQPQSIESDAQCEVELLEGEIAKDYYDDAVLTAPMPTQFRVDEIYLVSGLAKVDPLPDKAMVFFSPKDDPDTQHTFVGEVKNGLFHIPVHFAEAGVYHISVYPGLSGAAKAAEVTVSDPPCEPKFGIETGTTDGLRHEINKGKTTFHWNVGNNNLFRISFRQNNIAKNYFIYDKDSVMIPLEEFIDFEAGEFSVSLWAATAGINSLNRQTDWIFAGEETYTAAQHVSRRDNRIDDVHLTEEFEVGGTISAYGSSLEPMSADMVVIPPNEQIFDLAMDIDENDFSANFTAEQDGVYLVEINRDDKLSLFVGGTVPTGSLPIIPDYFDLREANQAKKPELDDTKMSEELLRYLNRERTARQLTLLELDTKLTNLATTRADDMCERDYFGHVTPDGKTAGDFMEEFAITGKIGENLSESGTVRGAHESLMRSPAHRELIISSDFDAVGFGFCWERDEPERLTTVQIFGERE